MRIVADAPRDRTRIADIYSMGRKRRGKEVQTVGITMNAEERVRFRLAVTHADVPAGVLVDRWARRYLARAGIRYNASDVPSETEDQTE